MPASERKTRTEAKRVPEESVAPDRILLNLADGLRRVVDPEDVYCLQVEGGETVDR